MGRDKGEEVGGFGPVEGERGLDEREGFWGVWSG